MFGTKYSRLTFWIWSVILIIPFSLFSTFSRATASDSELANSSLIFSGLVFIVILMWINALANRIRDYGNNPWIAVFSLIPLVNIGLALYYGIVKYKNKPIENNTVFNNSNPSLVKAVYNHSKDIASEVKPTINEYKEKHQTSKTDTNSSLSMDEDEIYEKVMLEIEEDKKVKSAWAKALAQSDGNRNKAEAIYIKLRVEEIENEYYKVQKSIEIEYERIEEENFKNEGEEAKIKKKLEKFRFIDEYTIRSKMYKTINYKGYKFIDRTNLVKDTWDEVYKNKRFQLWYNDPLLLVCENYKVIEEFHFPGGIK